jgi:predicted permease
VVAALKDGSRGAGRSRGWLGRALVVGEIALALVLLAGTGVMIQSFLALQNTDPGFETENLLTVQVTLPEALFPEDEQALAASEAIRERLAALPGVRAAAVASSLPRVPLGGHDPYTVEGQPLPEGAAPPRTQWDITSPEYFETVGISLLRGRLFDSRDREDSEPVALINTVLAERHWPGEDPIGQRITLRDETRRIIGVVSEVKHEMFRGEGDQTAMYVPWAQQPFRSASFLLRTEDEPEKLSEPARQAVLAVDPRLTIGQVQSLEQWLSQFFVGTRIFSVILGGFGLLALLLAMLGTYGVLAYMVAQRTHEIGVRMALGARRGQILRLMTVHGIKMALIGLVVGAPGVWLVVQAVKSLLSDFGRVPMGSVAGVAVVLVLVTLLASLLPARRAASIQPVEALHLE